MKAYLLITGVLFAAMTVMHVYIAIEHWGHSGTGFHAAIAPILIVAISGALALWAFWLVRQAPKVS